MPEKIKIFHRILGFQCKQRESASRASLRPDPSTGNTHVHTYTSSRAVEHIVKDLDTQMGHADLIHIREAHGETDLTLPGPSPTRFTSLPYDGLVSRFLIKYHHLTLTSSCFLSFFYFITNTVVLKILQSIYSEEATT